ncbi:large conductance mechanosensitive channel protein MscL [Aquibaculum arenosum]|uniref:Large-conductance mechanosensitive channel n=1 Tax=Aquibaculum arenosum TaxID=3032591 RepID=A0ABT5YJL4_9PROT|nr:large conductance mechanosensitive channel protein MscL [Fodinicurvata sp. CAU 1616]MDF2095134.1 large conductance mechanosensitive channel protein MscL [Fodinicurvata sp. CAU 1616]
MFNEFKAFISRGNVIDLAVGIILGTAFTAIVNSLVTDILMPPIGLLLGGVDFSSIFITLSGGEYTSLAEATEAGAATLNIGVFINTVINFLIIALAVFVLVKQVNRLYRREAEQPSAPPAPPRQEVLLEEIRDLLAQQRRE